MNGRVITYTKKDVVKRTAQKLGRKIYETEEVVDMVFKILAEIISEDKKEFRVEIRNFGVFEVKPTRAKPKARNPRTNKEVFVPPRRKTHFKPGKIIRDRLKKPLADLEG